MRELNKNEVQEVNGGGWLYDLWSDGRKIINEMDEAYRDAINSVANMMCDATGDCSGASGS